MAHHCLEQVCHCLLYPTINLISLFHSVDKEQIKQFGPEVAAAQWLLRNGAKFKWSKNNGLFDDYSKLVSDSSLQKDHIVEIDATESSITHVGFPYLSIYLSG